ADYPDCNDADSLRTDPLFQTLAGADPGPDRPLACGSTLARFQYAFTRRQTELPAEDRPAFGEMYRARTDRIRLLNEFLVAEQAIRPLAVGRKNWLHLGGDGALQPTAVLLSITASVKRHGLDPWAYLKHVLTELPARPAGTDLADLLPDQWARYTAGPVTVPS